MDMVSKQEYCYMWNQTIAKHGSVDVASCVYSYINDNINDNIENTSVEEITMFCDNCTGLNKNRRINDMLSQAVIKIENLENAHLIFPEKTYTQNCNDSTHASIEKAKKVININHPGHWDAVDQMACKNQSYEVKRMSQKTYFDFSTNINEIFDNLKKKPRDI